MNRAEAHAFLAKVLPFAAKGEDYCSTFNGDAIKDVNELITLLSEEYGSFIIDAYDPDTNSGGLVYIEADSSDTLYSSPSPTGLTLQLMEALYKSFDI